MCRFFPSGVVVLSGGADTQLKIWSAETGQCVATLTGHSAGIGTLMTSCCSTNTKRLPCCCHLLNNFCLCQIFPNFTMDLEMSPKIAPFCGGSRLLLICSSFGLISHPKWHLDCFSCFSIAEAQSHNQQSHTETTKH